MGRSDGRKPSGSRRREIKEIEDELAREVTFSKRRGCLFRKASELSILCGAEIAVIAYSPHGNPFVFGSPSATRVLDRFTGSASLGITTCEDKLDEYKRRDREAASRLAETRKRRRDAGSDRRTGRWWEEPVEVGDMDEEELEHYVERAERLLEKASRRAEELQTAVAASVDPSSTTTTTTNVASSDGGQKDHADNMTVLDAIIADEELMEELVLGGGLECVTPEIWNCVYQNDAGGR